MVGKFKIAAYLLGFIIAICAHKNNAQAGGLSKLRSELTGLPGGIIRTATKATDQQITATITASANDICPGTSIMFSASPSNGIAYLWYKNGISTGVTTATFTSSSLQNNDQVSCYITDLQGGAFSNVITVIVNDTQPPAINITASSANICAGTEVTFIATPVNGGPSPVYQWQKNGVNVGTNLSTYTTTTLNNNDAITCTLTSNAKCITPLPVSSYRIVMNVSSLVQAKGNIMASASSICAGTPVSFSMNMKIGTPVSYQWRINGITISTDSSFTVSNLADQDKISCDLTVNTFCSTGLSLSDTFIITVNPVDKATVSVLASADSICAGSPITFTAITANAGNNINYQWKINNINAGINSNVFTTSALQNNDLISCQITVKGVPCLLQNTLISDSYPIKVFALPTVSLPTSQNITSGNSFTLEPTINGNIINYSWSPAIGLSSASIKNPVASPANNITYVLTITSASGCTASGTTSLKITGRKITVSNAFTPNGDGINDTWNIENLSSYATCTVDVFSRYGVSVFHSLGYPQAWNGRFNNKPVPSGVYYYIIDLKNGSNPITGPITIIR